MNHLIDYLAQQLFAIGPALIFVPFVVKVRDPFERALKFIAAGTFVFFLLTTLRGQVHIHWTSIALYPLVLLSVQYYHQRKRRLLLATLMPFAIAGVLMRVYFIYQIVPWNHQGIDFYHDRDLWAEDIRELAGNDAVLFFQDFRQAPLYTFYSGETGVALFPGGRRQSQYELWHYEDSLQTRPVTWIQYVPMGGTILPTRMGQDIHYVRIPAFASYYNLSMTTNLPDTVSAGRDSVPVRLVIHNHRDTPVTFPPNHLDESPRLLARIRRETERGKKQFVLFQRFARADTIPAGASKAYTVSLPIGDLREGPYTMEFGIGAHPLGMAYNSPVLTVQVTE